MSMTTILLGLITDILVLFVVSVFINLVWNVLTPNYLYWLPVVYIKVPIHHVFGLVIMIRLVIFALKNKGNVL